MCLSRLATEGLAWAPTAGNLATLLCLALCLALNAALTQVLRCNPHNQMQVTMARSLFSALATIKNGHRHCHEVPLKLPRNRQCPVPRPNHSNVSCLCRELTRRYLYWRRFCYC